MSYVSTDGSLPGERMSQGEKIMSIAKVIEVIASSTKGIEDAVAQGVAKVSETVSDVEGVWVKDTKAIVRGGKITEWRVVLAITFVVK